MNYEKERLFVVDKYSILNICHRLSNAQQKACRQKPYVPLQAWNPLFLLTDQHLPRESEILRESGMAQECWNNHNRND